MNLLRKISVFGMLFVMSILFLVPVHADAATFRAKLLTPDPGWQRYDDYDSKSLITYEGSGWSHNENAITGRYNGSASCSMTAGDSIKIKFFGTKFRFISEDIIGHSSNINISIDNGPNEVMSISNFSIREVQCLSYEKTNLALGFHTVVITLMDTNSIVIDAIDIDDTGYLVDYYQPTNVVAIPGNTKVMLNWTAVPNATGYVIHYGTTSGILTGDKTVTGSSITSDVIEKLENGTKYYFTISSIINGTERTPSTEVSATPTNDSVPTDHVGNSSTLILTMTNGGIKNYDLSINDLDVFLTWYDKKSDGTGKSYYVFNKTTSIAPYKSVKEYVSFNKISSFEVKEFDK